MEDIMNHSFQGAVKAGDLRTAAGGGVRRRWVGAAGMLGLLGLALSVGPLPSKAIASEITEMAPGTKVADVVTMGRNDIPLPKGEWELVATKAKRSGSLGKIGDAYLVQESGESGVHAIYIRANVEVSNCIGWQRPKAACDRKDVHFNVSDRNYNSRDIDCWTLNHVVTDPYKETKNPFRKEVNKYRQDTLGRVATYIINHYMMSSQCNFVNVRYGTLPEKFGFPPSRDKDWKSSDWAPRAVRADPERAGLIAAVKVFGEQLHSTVRKAFNGELDDWTSDLALEFGE